MFEKSFNRLLFGIQKKDLNTFKNKTLIVNEKKVIDSCIPFEFITLMTGLTVITTYYDFMNLANQFYDKFNDDLFSKDALIFLNNKLKPYIEEMGYTHLDDPKTYNIIFSIDSIENVKVSKIQNSTNKIFPNQQSILLPKDFEKMRNDHDYYGTVIDNKIVSISGANMSDGFKATYISVNTVEEHRRRGYALSNVISIANLILNKGNDALYTCNKNNIASQKTATSAGFTEIAKEYLYVCK